MKYLLVAHFAVVAQCCLFAAAAHAHGDPDSVLEAALRPLYSQLDVFRDQLDAVKVLVHVPCKKDVLECSEAGPLGMEDGRIPNASITASSFWGNLADHAPRKARLNTEVYAASWVSAGSSDPNPWIQVDFGCIVIITSLITQGRGDQRDRQWVTEFQVAYSNDGQEWTNVNAEGESAPTKFPGNSDRNTYVTTTFPKAFQARFLRILPTQWSVHCSMRFEVIGCKSHE
ncbi:EGF-like repeat and discoidin I-like domain-containing protein 3 [Patiria miniata]|uniref:F5/8 type C domain-containing protein n=1 Tax=Patiria miniata TaxID=46514 RepID=A0A914A9U1_PATMI|nr:EGF-like repeat and discoidin I-like domain-containing protein 3 [Patiria miniata]